MPSYREIVPKSAGARQPRIGKPSSCPLMASKVRMPALPIAVYFADAQLLMRRASIDKASDGRVACRHGIVGRASAKS